MYNKTDNNNREVFNMFCRYCGNQLREDAKFCSSCGKPVEDVTQPADPVVTEEPVINEAPVADPAPVCNVTPTVVPSVQTQYQASVSEAQATEKQNSVLTYGILALSFALTGIISFLGIIFGAIAMNKANEYIRLIGTSTARVTVGKGLGKGGLIAGIALTAFFTLYILLIIVLVASETYYYY